MRHQRKATALARKTSKKYPAVRGQMDAPIELVVAIIIMVTSMGLAFYVIHITDANRCVATLKTQTQALQEAILDVGLGSAGSKKTVRFQMPRCGDQTVEGLQIVKFTAAEFCKQCPGHYAGCWLIRPVARTKDGLSLVNDAVTCIELPAERVTIEQEQASAGCSTLSTSPCPDTGASCTDELAIGSGLYTPGSSTRSSWVTLGKQDSNQYLITFNKILSVGQISHTQIKMCAVPVGGRTP